MSSNPLVRVNGDLTQVKGALILLAGNSAYFLSDDWLTPIEQILGTEMRFDDLVASLQGALDHARNPKFKEVDAVAWARRIGQPIDSR